MGKITNLRGPSQELGLERPLPPAEGSTHGSAAASGTQTSKRRATDRRPRFDGGMELVAIGVIAIVLLIGYRVWEALAS